MHLGTHAWKSKQWNNAGTNKAERSTSCNMPTGDHAMGSNTCTTPTGILAMGNTHTHPSAHTGHPTRPSYCSRGEDARNFSILDLIPDESSSGDEQGEEAPLAATTPLTATAATLAAATAPLAAAAAPLVAAAAPLAATATHLAAAATPVMTAAAAPVMTAATAAPLVATATPLVAAAVTPAAVAAPNEQPHSPSTSAQGRTAVKRLWQQTMTGMEQRDAVREAVANIFFRVRTGKVAMALTMRPHVMPTPRRLKFSGAVAQAVAARRVAAAKTTTEPAPATEAPPAATQHSNTSPSRHADTAAAQRSGPSSPRRVDTTSAQQHSDAELEAALNEVMAMDGDGWDRDYEAERDEEDNRPLTELEVEAERRWTVRLAEATAASNARAQHLRDQDELEQRRRRPAPVVPPAALTPAEQEAADAECIRKCTMPRDRRAGATGGEAPVGKEEGDMWYFLLEEREQRRVEQNPAHQKVWHHRGGWASSTRPELVARLRDGFGITLFEEAGPRRAPPGGVAELRAVGKGGPSGMSVPQQWPVRKPLTAEQQQQEAEAADAREQPPQDKPPRKQPTASLLPPATHSMRGRREAEGRLSLGGAAQRARQQAAEQHAAAATAGKGYTQYIVDDSDSETEIELFCKGTPWSTQQVKRAMQQSGVEIQDMAEAYAEMGDAWRLTQEITREHEAGEAGIDPAMLARAQRLQERWEAYGPAPFH